MDRRTFIPICLALGIAVSPAAAQQGRRLDSDRIHVIFRTIQSDLHRYYYDSTFHGIDIDARFRAAEERAQAAESNHQVFAIIAQTLSELNDSHTTFWPPDRTADVRYGWRPHMVGDTCVIVAVERGSDAERQGVHVGDRLLAVDGIRPNRRDFWKIEYLFTQLDPRSAVTMVLAAPGGPPRQLSVASRIIPRRRMVDLTGGDGGSDIWDLIRHYGDWEEEHQNEFARVGDTTLVWRLPTFAMDEDDLDEGIRRTKRNRTLILDLRGNQGGYESAVLRLIGATFPSDVEVGTLHRRKRNEPIRARAQEEPFQGRIIVLVDSRSASAAEIYAGTVQRLGRGTVLGDRSSGAVMRSYAFSRQAGGAVAVLYGLSITDGEFVLGDSLRLEHQGVLPDETVLPTSADVAAGRDPALARALHLAGHEVDAAAAGRLLRRGWRNLDLW